MKGRRGVTVLRNPKALNQWFRGMEPRSKRRSLPWALPEPSLETCRVPRPYEILRRSALLALAVALPQLRMGRSDGVRHGESDAR